MKRHTDLLTKRLKELTEELESDLKLNEINLKEQSLKSPAIKSKWLAISFEEQRYLNKLEDAVEKAKEEYIQNHGDIKNKHKFINQKEAERSDKVISIEKAIKNQKEVVRYCQEILKVVISGYGWDVRNSIDLTKIENM